MTASELLATQLVATGYQIEKVLEGLADADADFKVAPTAMSARQILEHLCEVYTAVEEMLEGQEHAWGEFSVEDKSLESLWGLYLPLREVATKIVTASDDPKLIEMGSAYLVGHDFYHVGQLASIRLALDSNWDPYSIYPHG